MLLNGSGFAAPDWSVRISFANLEDHVYDDIGRAVRAIARGYGQAYEAATGKSVRIRRGRSGPPRRSRSRSRRRRSQVEGEAVAARADRRRVVAPAASGQHAVHSRLGSPHELPADVASRTPRAGDLPDARHRVRDRPDQDRVLQVRQRPRHAHRGRAHRTTRHQGRRHGQVGLLLAVPVCHRLQGRTAVLSRLEEECAVPGRADGGPLRDQPGDDAGGGEAAQLRHRDRGRPDGRARSPNRR